MASKHSEKEIKAEEYELIRPQAVMRRQPKQERSIRVVNAIVDAAHEILLEHGRDGLTTTILEVVSGIPKSSIYQYFPDLDAIVFEVYRLVIRECHHKGFETFPDDQELTVLSFIYWLLDWAIDVHRKVMEIDEQLLLQHKGFWDTWKELDQNLAPGASTEKFIYEKLKSCSDFKSSPDDMMRVHALGRAAQLLVYSLITDNARFIDNPGFRDMLARMCYAIFEEADISAISPAG
ncbi:MAG: TetR/AcrR family transcriptional regulator [Porticoccaceae bacterium]|nr:TetR/AcrR family transcriptional regulator [Pseudomonadales bacterium]MCP5171719.1 TetR/AcrR family transcriptional regulator [Pseudomonadales bacterium]